MQDYKLVLSETSTSRTQRPNTFIRNKFGLLNIISNPLTGEFDLSSKREISDIENIVSELFDNYDDLKTFLFLKDKTMFETITVTNKVVNVNGDYSLKRWLHLIVSKISSYGGNNKFILEVKKLLGNLDQNSLSLTEPVNFNIENGELSAGKLPLYVQVIILNGTYLF